MFVLRLSQITQKSIARSPTQGEAESRSLGEKGTKMLTFGAKGFVLESAMADDDDEMRVGRGERIGQREFPSSRVLQFGINSHRTPNTAPHSPEPHPSGSLHLTSILNGSPLALAFFSLPHLPARFLSSHRNIRVQKRMLFRGFARQ